MSKITLTEYCKKIKPNLSKKMTQPQFITGLFIAAGSNFFNKDDEDYPRKLYDGSKPLTDNIKVTFNSFQTQKTIDWFNSVIAPDNIRPILSAFGIPVSIEENKNVLSAALALQFKTLTETKGNDADDIVLSEYQKCLTGKIDFTSFQSQFYPGDNVWVEKSAEYNVQCYDEFDHTWTIHNYGSVTWKNRKLKFINADSVRPSANPKEIDIPELKPNGVIKITTRFDARGFEGKYECLWEMYDEDGNNCFPNDAEQFRVTIITKFKA